MIHWTVRTTSDICSNG